MLIRYARVSTNALELSAHRCALISLESRAAQNDHDEIARAAKKLLDELDGD